MGHKAKDTTGPHLFLVLWKAFRSVEACSLESIRNLGLGRSDFGVLEALLHKGPLTVNVIARKVLLTSGSMTAAVDRLEAKGLVERTPDPADARARQIRLTVAGRRLIEPAFARHAEDLEKVFGQLGARDRESLLRLLRKVGRAASSN